MAETGPEGSYTNPFGSIGLPENFGYEDLCNNGLTVFATNVIKIAIVAAGLFAFINFLLAGFLYISSSGEPKKTAAAMQKINMSLIGLVIMVASFALAVIVGQLLLGDPAAILSPTIYGPGICT